MHKEQSDLGVRRLKSIRNIKLVPSKDVNSKLGSVSA